MMMRGSAGGRPPVGLGELRRLPGEPETYPSDLSDTSSDWSDLRDLQGEFLPACRPHHEPPEQRLVMVVHGHPRGRL